MTAQYPELSSGRMLGFGRGEWNGAAIIYLKLPVSTTKLGSCGILRRYLILIWYGTDMQTEMIGQHHHQGTKCVNIVFDLVWRGSSCTVDIPATTGQGWPGCCGREQYLSVKGSYVDNGLGQAGTGGGVDTRNTGMGNILLHPSPMTKRRYLKCFYNLLCRFANLQIWHCRQVPSHWPVAEQTQAPLTGDNQLRFALCSVGQCGHFEPGISSFTLWLCPLLSTTSALTVHQQCPLFTLCTQLTLSSTPIHPAPTPHFGPHINNNNCNYNIPEVVTPVEGLKSPIFALMTAQIRLFSYRNCGIHTSYMQPSIIVQYLGMGHDDGDWVTFQ